MKVEMGHNKAVPFFSHLVQVFRKQHLRASLFCGICLMQQYAPDWIIIFLSADLLNKYFSLTEAQIYSAAFITVNS